MNIAILAPSPVPFTLGGLEYLAHGIQRHVNEQTGHKAEVFKLPTIEKDFWTLIDSYYRFFKLDMGHFDTCLSMKYPTWMVDHDHHILYMAHPLRGLYDTYHFTGQSINPNKVSHKTEILLRSLEKINTRFDVEDIFGMCFDLQQIAKNSKEIQSDFIFPGPVARKVIHALDLWALSKMGKYGAISRTVSLREGYFPPSVDVKTVYPPSSLNNLHSSEDQGYFLSVSRLDNAKRVELFIKAMKQLQGGILLIVGSGPEENNLKAIAHGNERIKFLGRVSDNELVSLYSNCRAVLYAPYDEDYGLVTVEAFMSEKPVITCSDSGGVTEFVSDGVNGFVAMPTPDSIAEKMSIAINQPELMKNLGLRGNQIAKAIHWENLINWIVSDSNLTEKIVSTKAIKKTVVLSTYEIYPPKNGGQIRSYQLYSGFSALGTVTIISLGREGSIRENIISEKVKEIVIGRSERHIKEEALIEKEVKVPITDIVAASLIKYTPDFVNTLNKEIIDADILLLSHPYLVDLIPSNFHSKIILDAQDVEFDLKKNILTNKDNTIRLLDNVYRMEEDAIHQADKILVCTEEDRERLSEIYRDITDKAIIVPNGVDIEKISFVDQNLRNRLKKDAGITGTTCLFMGSWHQPNIDATKRIISLANLMPEIHFFIVGSVALAIKNDNIPRNVGILDDFDDATKRLLLSVSDMAIHPMDSGSGTNLKIFEYMAAGLPIVSTNHGIRGLSPTAKQGIFLAETDEEFMMTITEILHMNVGSPNIHISNLRGITESEYSWSGIISNALNNVKRLF